jgi:hypothetical protein
VPIFSGEAAESSDFLDEVKTVFASNVVAAYLTDASTCNANPDWSNALASRIRASLRKSKILNFLAIEQQDVKSCCSVYRALDDYFRTMDLQMARTFEK